MSTIIGLKGGQVLSVKESIADIDRYLRDHVATNWVPLTEVGSGQQMDIRWDQVTYRIGR